MVFLGDSAVGKTCIARLLIGRQVHHVPETTIGFDFHCREFVVDGVPLVVSRTDMIVFYVATVMYTCLGTVLAL